MQQAGNKLQPKHENPIDILCVRFASAVSPSLYKMGATPNMITTFSLLASLYAVWNIYVGGRKKWFVIWAILAYLFDCIDGHFARRYNMCTVFGDYYDHISDWVYFIALFYVAFWVRGFTPAGKKYKPYIIAALVLTGLGAMLHMGFQEDIYAKKSESPTLNIFKRISKTVCTVSAKCAETSRWFGVGTFIATTIFVVALWIR